MTIDTPPDDRRPDPPDGSDWTSFLQWCLPQLRMRWGGFRKVRRQVCRRIRRRMEELNLPDIEAYRRRLSTHPDEWRVLDDLCRVSISRIYRDRRLFEFLSAEGLPALAAAAEGAPLRCWSAAESQRCRPPKLVAEKDDAALSARMADSSAWRRKMSETHAASTPG